MLSRLSCGTQPIPELPLRAIQTVASKQNALMKTNDTAQEHVITDLAPAPATTVAETEGRKQCVAGR
jgi:hypothetical protein